MQISWQRIYASVYTTNIEEQLWTAVDVKKKRKGVEKHKFFVSPINSNIEVEESEIQNLKIENGKENRIHIENEKQNMHMNKKTKENTIKKRKRSYNFVIE